MSAHSASRCELLARLGHSFRTLYPRLPVLVTCECEEAPGTGRYSILTMMFSAFRA